MIRIATSKLKEYVELQQRLLFTLFQSLGADIDESNFRSSIPVTGVLILQSEEWTYRRHGDGVYFTNGDLEVDVVKHLFADPTGFEAWRLKVYFESAKQKKISIKSVERLLNDLTTENILYKYPHKELYVFNVSWLGLLPT